MHLTTLTSNLILRACVSDDERAGPRDPASNKPSDGGTKDKNKDGLACFLSSYHAVLAVNDSAPEKTVLGECRFAPVPTAALRRGPDRPKAIPPGKGDRS